MLNTNVIIVDTNIAPSKWHRITVEEADGKISVVSVQTFCAALENAVKLMQGFESDYNNLVNNPDSLFAPEWEHEFPVSITAQGDFYNVVFTIEESED